MKIKFKKYWRKTSLKNKKDGDFLLKHIEKAKPKNFLEIGVFHGVTSRNVCDILHLLHGNDFKFKIGKIYQQNVLGQSSNEMMRADMENTLIRLLDSFIDQWYRDNPLKQF